MRRGAAFQGGGDVRGTPVRPTWSATGYWSPSHRPPVDWPTNSTWHQVCDQARDLCRSSQSTRSHATSQ
jgi:hypothetical protein